jgi:serine/threonine-protein kinase GIN4
LSRSNHSLRAPRRILAANHIFAQENEAVAADGGLMGASTTEKDQVVEYRRSWMDEAFIAAPEEPADRISTFTKLSDVPSTPMNHRRRATIGTRSPEMLSPKRPSLEIDLTPSRRREKSKSQNDLQMFIGRPITPVNRLEFEVEQRMSLSTIAGSSKLTYFCPVSKPAPVPRLSTLVDPSLFISDASGSKSRASFMERPRVDDLMASPLHVEPYPARPASKSSLAVDTPAKKHLEGVYDRYVKPTSLPLSMSNLIMYSFLMSTTGVKRVGRGYQSDVALPVMQAPQPQVLKRNSHFFLSARRPMPPPVSSDDLHRVVSFEEWGTKPAALAAAAGSSKSEESSGSTVGIVRRALKAMTVKRL